MKRRAPGRQGQWTFIQQRLRSRFEDLEPEVRDDRAEQIQHGRCNGCCKKRTRVRRCWTPSRGANIRPETRTNANLCLGAFLDLLRCKRCTSPRPRTWCDARGAETLGPDGGEAGPLCGGCSAASVAWASVSAPGAVQAVPKRSAEDVVRCGRCRNARPGRRRGRGTLRIGGSLAALASWVSVSGRGPVQAVRKHLAEDLERCKRCRRSRQRTWCDA